MNTNQKSKWFCVLILLLLITPFSLFAQIKQFNLSQLIDSAKNYLPVIKQKQAFINAANANVVDTKHSFLPQLKFQEQLNIGSDNSLAGSYFPLGIVPSTSGGVINKNNANAATGNVAVLYSEYELYNFGLNASKLENAKAFVNLAQTDLEKEQYFITLNIAKLYLNILKNQYQLKADSLNIERYQNIFSVIKALTLSGIKPGSDSSLAKTELSKTKINYNQTLGNLNQLKEQLIYFTGITAKVFYLDSLQNNQQIFLPVLSQMAVDSLNNPLINYYAMQKDIYLSNEKLISKNYLPKILLAGSTWARGSSIQYNNQFESLATGFGYQRYNYALGVAFTYNLFNGIYKKDKLAINKYQIQASDFQLQQQKLALLSASSQADNALQTAKNNLAELPVQLQSATDNYNQEYAQYKAGLISIVDLNNASFVLFRSQTDYIQSLNDWYLGALDKAAATGNLYLFINNLK